MKVFHLSNHDIAYLIRAWKWTYKGSYGGTGPTMTIPAVIGGVTYWFCRPHPGYPVWDHLAVYTEFAIPKTDDLQGWIDKMNAKLKGPKIDGYPGGPNMLIALDLDLSPGMTLAKLKTSIERFAKQAAPFVRGDFSKPPPDPMHPHSSRTLLRWPQLRGFGMDAPSALGFSLILFR